MNSADQQLLSMGYRPQLKRTLNTWDLTAFGLNYLQPIGPAVIFGSLLLLSGGTVALPYLIACLGMLFTARSYAIITPHFPLAGSVYNYIGRICHPHLGFLVGWLLILDYLLIPVITVVSAATYAHQFLTSISYTNWLIIFVLSMGYFNLTGIKLTAKIGFWILLIEIAIVFAGFIIWSYFIVKHRGLGMLLSWQPLHFTSYQGLAAAVSLAVFSYLGFDAISTMAEEAIDPVKFVPKAIYLTLGIGCLTMFLSGYLGVLTIPNWEQHLQNKDWENATLFHVAKLTGGDFFAGIYTIGFIMAMVVTNIVGTAAGSRLLFGMGRDGVLSKKFFGAVNQKWRTPHWNIFLIASLEFIFGLYLNPSEIAELINYGALVAFIMLNISVFWFFYRKNTYKNTVNSRRINQVKELGFPLVGAAIMIFIFVNMQKSTLIFGTVWLLIGILYYYFFQKNYKLSN